MKKADYTVMIDGVSVPLTISAPAILMIERETGRTLLQHLRAAADRDISLAHLTTILRHLAGPDCPIEGLRGPVFDDETSFAMSIDMLGGDMEASEIIVRNGIVNVISAVMIPLVSALGVSAK